MATCQACGAENPMANESCENCGAEIAPVHEMNPERAANSTAGQAGSHGGAANRKPRTPDWLKTLDIPWDDELTSLAATVSGEAVSELPHWLAELDIAELDGEGESAREGRQAIAEGAGEIPGWLSDLESATPEGDEQEPLTPSWLAQIDAESPGISQPVERMATTESQASEPPAWLTAAVISEQRAAQGAPPSHATGERAISAATSATEEEEESTPEPAAVVVESARESDLGPISDRTVPAAAAVAIAQDGELDSKIDVESSSKNLLPDWLRGVDIAAIQALLVDRDFDAEEDFEAESYVDPEENGLEALVVIAATELVEESVDTNEVVPGGGEVAVASVAALTVEEATAPEETDEFTSWLRGLAGLAVVHSAVSEHGDASEPGDNMDGLLTEVDQLFYGSPGDDSEEFGLDDPLPKWLDETLQAAEGSATDPAATVEAPSQLEGVVPVGSSRADDPLPDWLQDGPEPDVGADDGDREKAALGLAAATLLAGGSATSTGTAGGLQEAELPDWLIAIQQGDLLASDQVAEAAIVAESGPLAGIPGVLGKDAPAVTGQNGDSAMAATSLSPEQRQQLAVLTQLGSDDLGAQQAVASARRSVEPARVQLVLGLLLLLAIFIGLLGPQFLAVDLPAASPAVAVREAVDAAAGKPVLVAFEYSPAMAGELSPQAALLLSDLAANGSSALLVSQSPAGITLAEELALNTPGLSSLSVGYLAGETVGLRQLASCLADSTACATLSGEQVDDALRRELGQVSLIVILAAERDGLLSWVEQVGPAVDESLVAGVTQAIAPIAAPYYETGQLSGVIAGLPATAAYERLNDIGSEGGGTQQVDKQVWAFTLSVWLIIVLLVVGNFYWLGNRMLRRNRGTE